MKINTETKEAEVFRRLKQTPRGACSTYDSWAQHASLLRHSINKNKAKAIRRIAWKIATRSYLKNNAVGALRLSRRRQRESVEILLFSHVSEKKSFLENFNTLETETEEDGSLNTAQHLSECVWVTWPCGVAKAQKVKLLYCKERPGLTELQSIISQRLAAGFTFNLIRVWEQINPAAQPL